VAISVLHDGTRDLLGLAAEGTADFAITPLTHRTTAALSFETLLSTPLVLLCPPAHRLAGARGVDLGDVVDEPLIDLAVEESVADGPGRRTCIALFRRMNDVARHL
jgi:DNA-binding transcriptional LysR family regulator